MNPAPKLHHGMRIPPFVEGGTPATDPDAINVLVAAANALLNLEVHRHPAVIQSDGTTTSSAKVVVSNLNVAIDLSDA